MGVFLGLPLDQKERRLAEVGETECGRDLGTKRSPCGRSVTPRARTSMIILYHMVAEMGVSRGGGGR